MHRLLRADNSTKHLDGAVGDYLIDIHVRLRARAGLKDHQREMIVQVTSDHLVARRHHGCTKLGCQLAILHVVLRGALFQDPEGADHLQRHL